MADVLPQQYAALSKPLATAKMFEARKDFVTVYWIRNVFISERLNQLLSSGSVISIVGNRNGVPAVYWIAPPKTRLVYFISG